VSDRTWRSFFYAAGDGAVVRNALGDSDERGDAGTAEQYWIESEGIPDPEDLAPLVEAGIPFFGSHGGYAGSYDPMAFASDGAQFEEWLATEDGTPVINLAMASVIWRKLQMAYGLPHGGELADRFSTVTLFDRLSGVGRLRVMGPRLDAIPRLTDSEGGDILDLALTLEAGARFIQLLRRSQALVLERGEAFLRQGGA
jgi:hypothetical protein